MALPAAQKKKNLSPFAAAPVLVPVAIAVVGAYAIGSFYGVGGGSQPTRAILADVTARAGMAGASVVFADAGGVREISIATGERFSIALAPALAPASRAGAAARRVSSPAVSPDGRTLVYLEEPRPLESAVMSLDLASSGAAPREIFRAAAVGPVAFARDGSTVAFAARDGAPGTPGALVVVESGRPARKLAPGRAEVGADSATAPSFSPDGSVIAFTGHEGTAEFVDRATGETTARFRGLDPVFLGEGALGFEIDGLRFRATWPVGIDPKTRDVTDREFEHAFSRERRRGPLSYSPSGDVAAFVRSTGRRHTFPPGPAAQEILELCLIDVPSARVLVLVPDFGPEGAVSLSTRSDL